MNTKCNKCGSEKLFVEVQGTRRGLYCGECGKWQKWITKQELQIAKFNGFKIIRQGGQSMTKEQAIEIIEGMIQSYIEADKCGLSNNDFKHEIRALQTVLNMLKEKDAEIEKLKSFVCHLQLEDIKNLKTKICMAEQLAGLAIFDDDKEEPLILGDKEEVIKYFERKSNEI